MTYPWQVMAAVAEARAVAIVRESDAAMALERAQALVSAGIGVLEVTLTTPDALHTISRLKSSEVIVGAGTVLDAHGAYAAASAGASFIVTPTLSCETVRAARRYGMACIVGCATATESLAAIECGADAVKLFPAAAGGVDTLRALREPLPQIGFIPTGGVSLEAVADWLRAGAIAVGLGSALSGTGPELAARVARLQEVLTVRPGSAD